MTVPTCNDLRIGGTLSSAGITGGLSINSTNISVSDWSTLLGSPGISGQGVEVAGRPGATIVGDQLGLPRFPILSLNFNRRDAMGGLTEPTPAEQLQANTDEFLSLLQSEQYLEVDMPDGTSRFLLVWNLQPGLISQPARRRRIAVPLQSDWPYWTEGGTENSQTINGADTITNGGGVSVYDAVLEFSGDGTFTHSDLGWAIEVTGSAGAVTVDLGARTVTEGGMDATNRIRRTVVAGQGRVWGWFPRGVNNVSTDVPVDVTWRDQFS